MQSHYGPTTAICIAGVSLLVAACGTADRPDERILGQSWPIGNGTVTPYAEFAGDGSPSAIGIVYTAGALEGLPTAASDAHHCFDRDSNGSIEPDSECLATHETVMPLPDAVARHADIPYKWVMFNWNPVGHIPPGIYDVPHFDIHFYIDSIADVFALEPGPCGPEFIRCDQFERATKPLPANYMPPDYVSVDAVAPAMGNHLIDPTGPEFNGEQWTRNWIFGTYDGKITFYEEMVTLAHLQSRPDACNPVKSPPGVALSGYYPALSCVRYEAATDAYTVSMEGFTYREASPPLTAAR